MFHLSQKECNYLPGFLWDSSVQALVADCTPSLTWCHISGARSRAGSLSILLQLELSFWNELSVYARLWCFAENVTSINVITGLCVHLIPWSSLPIPWILFHWFINLVPVDVFERSSHHFLTTCSVEALAFCSIYLYHCLTLTEATIDKVQ